MINLRCLEIESKLCYSVIPLEFCDRWQPFIVLTILKRHYAYELCLDEDENLTPPGLLVTDESGSDHDLANWVRGQV